MGQQGSSAVRRSGAPVGPSGGIVDQRMLTLLLDDEVDNLSHDWLSHTSRHTHVSPGDAILRMFDALAEAEAIRPARSVRGVRMEAGELTERELVEGMTARGEAHKLVDLLVRAGAVTRTEAPGPGQPARHSLAIHDAQEVLRRVVAEERSRWETHPLVATPAFSESSSVEPSAEQVLEDFLGGDYWT